MSDEAGVIVRQFIVNLRQRRQELNLTRAQAATRAGGMAAASWGKIERGEQEPGLRTAARMAVALDSTLASLVTGPERAAARSAVVSEAEHRKNARRLGANLTRRRAELNLSGVQAAKRADMDPSQWSRIERGEVSPGVVVLSRLARALGMTADELLEGLE
jgi:transcriptional regulator with XRE-family HTH domain